MQGMSVALLYTMKKLLLFAAFVSLRVIYCAIFIAFFSFYAGAQELSIRLYTAKEGLPSTYVFGTFQDKLGYLWISTTEGPCRFDGRSFSTDGLSDGRTAVVFVDSHMRYWSASSAGIFEYRKNKLISYPNPDSGRIRWSFGIMETKEGIIWSLTSAGVYQLNTDKWIKIKFYPGYDDHPCRNIIETKNGLYINYGDLLVLKKPDGVYKIIGAFKNAGYYYNDLSASAGQILISTLDGMYEIINEQLVKLPGPLGRLKGLYIYFRDSKKRFWVDVFPTGLHLIPTGDTTSFISVYKAATGALINHINEDKQGNIWITTANGLIKIYEKGFKSFDLPTITGNKFLFNVLQPPNGPLLINDGSLTLKALENGIFINKKLHNKGSSPIPNNEFIIDNYAFDDKGRFWYYIRGFALVVQDGDNVYEQSEQLAHLGDEVFDVLWDRYREKIIVAVRKQNLPCQFNDTSYSVLPVVNDLGAKGDNIRRLHQTVNGTILFATEHGSIYSVDKSNICKLQLYEFGTHTTIRWMYNDPSGDVWIIYNGRGLRRYGWQKDSLVFKEQLTKANGLSSDNVTSMCFDNKNNLWACTNSTVTVFAKKDNISTDQSYQVIGFFNSEDLQSGGAAGARLTKDNKGNIWYFSGKYLTCFYEGKVNYKPNVPVIEIENVELNLRETNWSGYVDSLSGVFQLPYYPKLSHDNNTIGIYFKGISSSGTDGIKYSYQLEGLENMWSNPSSNDFVSFGKLPPGKYLFKVKAQLPNTDWSKPATFSFAIISPFWMKWWFIGLCAIMLSGITYSIYRYRINQLKKLLAIRTKISQDLHDEIGSTLTSINILSIVSQNNLEKDKSKASELLQKISEQSADMQQSMSDIVWSIRPDNDKMENLVIRMREYLGQTAEARNMQIQFSVDEKVLNENLSMQNRQHIFLIFKEAVNNAVKYSEGKAISVFLGRENSHIRLSVKDDGTGFNAAKITSSSGLKNMQARAKELNGTLRIRSAAGSGTEVELICTAT
jgi:ligand-binding sensor domain-containing protein/two-component sensor histidine kinase